MLAVFSRYTNSDMAQGWNKMDVHVHTAASWKSASLRSGLILLSGY